MPRKSKEELNEIVETPVKQTVKTKAAKTKKVSSTKRSTSQASASNKDALKKAKKISSDKDPIKNDKKTSSDKDATKKAKKTPSKKTSSIAKVIKSVKDDLKKGSKKEEKEEKKTVKKSIKKSEETKKEKKSKTTSKVTKSTTTKKNVAKEKVSAAKSTKSAKESKTKKTTKTTKTSRTRKASTANMQKKIEILEYYDLPYRYNETIVKILAQTPTTLFVYWDISDSDKEQYIKEYGTYFFNNTKPVLIVHNTTKNYSFEVDINDFANSWYLHIADGSNCDFQVELGRRPINQYVNIENNYLHITDSNHIVSQNDHILFDKLSHIVYFRNVKTNQNYGKKITSLSLLQRIGKIDINFIKEFYKKLYPDETIDFDKLDLRNPSSGNPTSTFK